MAIQKRMSDEFESVGYYSAKAGRTFQEASKIWRSNSVDYAALNAKDRIQAIKAFQRGFVSGKTKANPTSFPKGKFIPVEAVRYNRNGTVTVKVKDSVVRSNPTLKRNMANGYIAGGVFHPIRSSPDYDPSAVGEKRKTKKKTTKKKAAPKRKAVKRAPANKKKTTKRKR